MSDHFAVKRITSELKELQKNPSRSFIALPIDSDLFDWHFTLKGPADSVYSEGLYHGRLILPLNYPLKPPKFLMFNQSGRFEIGREICMSNTSFHPDEWQPAWTIRTILEGLISFFPEETEGAIGALRASEDTRRSMATNSWNWSCSNCGKLSDIWKGHCESLPVEATAEVLKNDKNKEESEEKKAKSSEIPGEEKKNIDTSMSGEDKVNDFVSEEIKEEEQRRIRIEELKKIEAEKEKFKHFPSEAEVRRFIKHADSRITVIEIIIGLLVTVLIGSKFFNIPGLEW